MVRQIDQNGTPIGRSMSLPVFLETPGGIEVISMLDALFFVVFQLDGVQYESLEVRREENVLDLRPDIGIDPLALAAQKSSDRLRVEREVRSDESHDFSGDGDGRAVLAGRWNMPERGGAFHSLLPVRPRRGRFLSF